MSNVMDVGYGYCFRVISKISQVTGLRDLNGECSLSPYLLWAGSAGGNQGVGDFSLHQPNLSMRSSSPGTPGVIGLSDRTRLRIKGENRLACR